MEEKKPKWEYTAIAEYMYKRLGYPLDDMPWEWYDTLRSTIDGVIEMICQMYEGDFHGLADFVTNSENELWIKDQKIKELEQEVAKLKIAKKKKKITQQPNKKKDE